MQTELIELAIAIAVLALIMLVLRRASAASRERESSSVRERLGVEPAGDPKRKPAAVEPAKPAPEPDAEPAATDEETAAAYKAGLAKTRGGFVARLGKLFGKKQIDAQTVDELEEVLFTADIGPRAADHIFQAVKTGLSKTDLEDPEKIWAQIRKASQQNPRGRRAAARFSRARNRSCCSCSASTAPARPPPSASSPRGSRRRGQEGRAGRRRHLPRGGHRAARRLGAARQRPDREGQSEGSDPGAVAFETIKRARETGADIVLIDTAGRLHTKAPLMEELKKIKRVLEKAQPGAPHQTCWCWTRPTARTRSPRHANSRSRSDVTGIALTKLDGTAKGGVVIGICDELKVPVRYVGRRRGRGRPAGVRPARVRRGALRRCQQR